VREAEQHAEYVGCRTSRPLTMSIQKACYFHKVEFIVKQCFPSDCICLNLPCMECDVEGWFFYFYGFFYSFITVDVYLGKKCMNVHV